MRTPNNLSLPVPDFNSASIFAIQFFLLFSCIGFSSTVTNLAKAQAQVQQQGPEEIHLMRQKDRTEAQEEYYIKLLELALENTVDEYGPYKLELTDSSFYQDEGLDKLRRGEGDIEILYTMTSKTREMVLQPIRIPILKGLGGHRVSFVRMGDEDIMANAKLKSDLKQYTFVQGADWPDTKILKANGLNVKTSQSYNNLFQMLVDGEVEAFPRAVTELWGELRENYNLDIAVEKFVVIQYPSAFYFFVNKNNQKLATRIEKGLNQAIEEGTFDTLFNVYNQHYVRNLNLKNRTYIKLNNPLLPDKTPVNRQELWLNMGQTR